MSDIALFFDALGSILIGIAVLRVHRRVMREQKIDAAVLREMRRERAFAVAGILSIAAGFFLNLAT